MSENDHENSQELPKIQCQIMIDIRLDDHDNAVKAHADVTFASQIGEFTISGFKLIQKDEKPLWVAMPEIRYKEENGEYKGVRKVYASKMFTSKISEMIITKYQEKINGGVPF